MKRYIRAAIFLTYTLLKFLTIKIFHNQNFKFTKFNLISPFTTIEIIKGGRLNINRMVKINSGSKLKVRKNAFVEIGENTFINHNTLIVSHEKILIGKDVQIGPNVLIYDHDHDFRAEDGVKSMKYVTSPVEIGDNVWIGANTIILRGTKLGNNCVIAANSVIKGEIKDNMIVYQKREIIQKEILLNR